MTAPIDSVKGRDEEFNKAQIKKQIAGDNRITVITQVVFLNRNAQMFNRELNNAARSFLKFTNDPLHLSKALQWSARANEFFDNYISLNTHAQLLYMTGKKEEAEQWQLKAIALKRDRGFETRTLEDELTSMKNGNFKIQ
jgi:hypothetical protein